MLEPSLWLDAATNYTHAYTGDVQSCSQYEANRDPVCVTFNSSQQSVLMLGNGLGPMRFSDALQAPLRLRGRILRNFPCSGHYLALSTSPEPPSYPGLPPAC